MPEKSCGAKTRSGEPCKKAPMEGKKRCKLHGGASTGPKKPAVGNKNAAKPGSIYSQFLTPEEQEAFDALELGRVDDELRLMRIRLARALKAEEESANKPELDSVTQRQGGGPSTVAKEVTLKRRDYTKIIDSVTARIESLERTRAELERKGADDDLDVTPESKTFTYNVVDGRKSADADAD